MASDSLWFLETPSSQRQSVTPAQCIQVSNLYPNADDSYVRSHQLWAACTLFQATQEDAYWEDAELIYTTFIRPEPGEDDEPPAALEPYQLFDPVANYYNPLWWGLLCMAQSGPEYTGLEDRATLEVPDRVADGAEDDDNFLEFLLDQEFDRGTRAEVTQQIWRQFVLSWITYDGALEDANDQRITCVSFYQCSLQQGYDLTNRGSPIFVASNRVCVAGVRQSTASGTLTSTGRRRTRMAARSRRPACPASSATLRAPQWWR